jgi:molybdopterin converting factor small subunit
MGLVSSLRRIFSPDPAGSIRVRVILKGRTGSGWHDVDERLTLPPGTTLGGLIDAAERCGIRLRHAIESSPHLRHTLMLNGERRPVDENLDRPLADGDEVYLLAPFAGG